MKNIKYQSLKVTVPSATSAGSTVTDEIYLDSQYQEVTGVQLNEISDGGITNNYYGTGIKDQDKVYHDIVHKQSFEGGNAGPDGKFKSVSIPIASRVPVIISTLVPAALTTDLIYEVVFKIEDKRINA